MHLYNLISNFNVFSLNVIENNATRKDPEKGNNLLTLIIKVLILFAHVITMSTARASSVSPSSYTNTIFNQSARMLSYDCFLNTDIK